MNIWAWALIALLLFPILPLPFSVADRRVTPAAASFAFIISVLTVLIALKALRVL